MLLKKSEAGVEQDDDSDDDGVLEITNRPGQNRRTDQDQDQQTPELVEKLQPDGARCFLRQAIGAVFSQAPLHLLVAQTCT